MTMTLIGAGWIVVILVLAYLFSKMKYRDHLYDTRGPVSCEKCKWVITEEFFGGNELMCVHPREIKYRQSKTFASLKNSDFACVDWEGVENDREGS
jgi:hypothetical protein